MKKSIHLSTFCLFLFLSVGLTFNGLAQRGFHLPKGQKKDRISFEFINNLVVIPVEVNGTQLSFLLDTGVNYTLLFTLNENDSLKMNEVTPISIRGLGDGGDIEALKSLNNVVQVGDAVDKNHEIYVIFDERINFSPRMGIPIHGVIGFDLFKDFVVKTSYVSKVLTLYDPLVYKERKCRSCETFDLYFRNKKPHVELNVSQGDILKPVNLLVDSGASDAIWLFEDDFGISKNPKKYFEDFLGLGLSGNVYGRRAKLEEIRLGGFQLKNVNVSFPDSIGLRNLNGYTDRNGTLGSDILKRFTVIMDYRSRKMILQKNKKFRDPFHYNMAGLIIEHDGMVPVKEFKGGGNRTMSLEGDDPTGKVNIQLNTILTFFLAPKFIVAEVRKGSPAEEAGLLKGDEVLSINGKPAYFWELHELTELFSSRSGKKISIGIERNGYTSKKRFILKEVL